MNSSVLELQKAALNIDYPLSNLLRMAYLLAKKLNITEFESWISHELHGYPNNTSIPDYRKVKCVFKARLNNRLLPVDFQDAGEFEETVTAFDITQSISELESPKFSA